MPFLMYAARARRSLDENVIRSVAPSIAASSIRRPSPCD